MSGLAAVPPSYPEIVRLAGATPVVCFAQAGMREFARARDTVAVPAAPTPVAVADTLERLLYYDDEEKEDDEGSSQLLSRAGTATGGIDGRKSAKEMGERLREEVLERFSVETTVARYASLYRDPPRSTPPPN